VYAVHFKILSLFRRSVRDAPKIPFDNFFNKLELYNVMTCKIVLEVVLMLNVLLASKSIFYDTRQAVNHGPVHLKKLY
jgi:hypothetical protein